MVRQFPELLDLKWSMLILHDYPHSRTLCTQRAMTCDRRVDITALMRLKSVRLLSCYKDKFDTKITLISGKYNGSFKIRW